MPDYDIILDEAGCFDELETVCEACGYEKPDPDDYANYWEPENLEDCVW